MASTRSESLNSEKLQVKYLFDNNIISREKFYYNDDSDIEITNSDWMVLNVLNWEESIYRDDLISVDWWIIIDLEASLSLLQNMWYVSYNYFKFFDWVYLYKTSFLLNLYLLSLKENEEFIYKFWNDFVEKIKYFYDLYKSQQSFRFKIYDTNNWFIQKLILAIIYALIYKDTNEIWNVNIEIFDFSTNANVQTYILKDDFLLKSLYNIYMKLKDTKDLKNWLLNKYLLLHYQHKSETKNNYEFRLFKFARSSTKIKEKEIKIFQNRNFVIYLHDYDYHTKEIKNFSFLR